MNNYTFDELYIGLKEEFEVTVTEEKMKQFENISGDINPLHINKEYANSKNMPDRVVYGMLTSSFYSTLVGVYLPGEKCLLQGIDINFKLPVFIGEKLKVVGEVKYLNEAYKVMEIKAFIKNEKGKKVSTALIKVGII